jgi:hypothetical protein
MAAEVLGIGTKTISFLVMPILAAMGCLALVKPAVRRLPLASGVTRFIRAIAAHMVLGTTTEGIIFTSVIAAAGRCE